MYDVITIGDVVTDVFIRIKQANVHTDDAAAGEQLCFLNGAKIPYEFAKELPAVGNSANAAVCMARLGLHAAFVSDIGDDRYGQENIVALKKNGVGTNFIKVHPSQTSNYHYVLWYKSERTILIKHEAYDYALPDLGDPAWIYFSSVGENSLAYHQEISHYLETHPSIKLAFQPGTFQIKLGRESLKDIYQRTYVFFCNVEEARIILKSREPDPMQLARMIFQFGPKIVAITDGPHGAYIFDGIHMYTMPVYPDPAPPYERTGAGDAFASTFTAALALGMGVTDAMRWAPINAMSVVQKIGAQEGLLTRVELEAYLAKAPSEYTVRVVG